MLKQGKSREQLFIELAELKINMEKKLEVQEQFIKRFQMLVQTEEEFLEIINLFSCPIAVFKRSGYLHRVNHTLAKNTDLDEEEVSRGKINFLGRVTNENFALLEAAEGVFYGKTVLLSRLSCPLELFCKNWSFPVCDDYHSALLFPLPDNKDYIHYGAIMLMN